MIKGHKKELIISSILILCPIIAGVILWDKLPDTMAIHWGIDNQENGWSSKAFVVFGMPLILEALHWICLIGSSFDKRNQGHNEKVLRLFYWFIPIISIITNSLTYAMAMDVKLSIGHIAIGLAGVVFIIIGNYIPKVTQNHTFGIRIKWTLEDENNWSITHRAAGKIAFIGGFVCLACIFLPLKIAAIVAAVILLVAVVTPVVISYTVKKKTKQ